MLESVLPADMYRTLTGLMFSIMMSQEAELDHTAQGAGAHSPRDIDEGIFTKNGYAPVLLKA
jgi:hypothetical protein